MTKEAFDKIAEGLNDALEIVRAMPMTWNYRIIKHDGADCAGHEWFALHEVYTDNGKMSWSEDPISFVCDVEEGPDGVIKSLELALSDARTRPVLLMSELMAQPDRHTGSSFDSFLEEEKTSPMTEAQLDAYLADPERGAT
jgi:hypothetical protein